MTKPTAWMPFYWGDYLRDTGHLSTEEHGAYLLLIAHYWNTGKALPADEKYLQKISQLSSYKMKKYLPVLAAFFTIEGGKWHHPRIERELTAAYDNNANAITRGKRSAAVQRSKQEAQTGLSSVYKQSTALHHHPMNHESVTTDSTDAARDPARNGGSGPRASRPETSKERLLRLAEAHRQKTLRQGEP